MERSSSNIEFSVETEINNGVGTLTFFNSHSNSLPLEQMLQIANKIHHLGRQPDVRVIVIKSLGEKVFCAGASFDELLTIKHDDDATEFFMGFAKIILAIRKVPKIVVVRSTGKTVGGGVGIIAAADYSFTTTSASFRLSELSLGFGPFVIGPAVKRKIGLSAFSSIALQPETLFSADWAYDKGLISSLHENIDEMDHAIEEFTRQLSGRSADAIASFKRVLWQETNNWENLMTERAKLTGELVLSSYSREKIQNFMHNK